MSSFEAPDPNGKMKIYLVNRECIHGGEHERAHRKMALLERSPGVYWGAFVDDDRADLEAGRPKYVFNPSSTGVGRMLDRANGNPSKGKLAEGYQTVVIPFRDAMPLLRAALSDDYWGSWDGESPEHTMRPPESFECIGREFSTLLDDLPSEEHDPRSGGYRKLALV